MKMKLRLLMTAWLACVSAGAFAGESGQNYTQRLTQAASLLLASAGIPATDVSVGAPSNLYVMSNTLASGLDQVNVLRSYGSYKYSLEFTIPVSENYYTVCKCEYSVTRDMKIGAIFNCDNLKSRNPTSGREWVLLDGPINLEP